MSENPFLAALEAAVAEARRSSGTLDERLGIIRDRVAALDAGFAGVVERMIDRLKLARAGQGAPLPGEPMPEFALPDDTGRIVTLSSLT
ncbi:MAG TPA: hypothetical protein VKS60_25725, partial [Stellaceae bacterium]|nr:hypothetical protein [Stellaceae bacterium]